MNQKKETRNRQKQRMAAALALVLIGALVWPESSEPLPGDAASPAQGPAAGQQTAAASPAHRQAIELPRMSLEEIVGAEPFVSDAASVAKASGPPAESEAAGEAERPRLQAVYGGVRGNTALVEHRILREGDELSEGRRVERIAPHGITIRRVSGG